MSRDDAIRERTPIFRGDPIPDETEWSPFRECYNCNAPRPLYRFTLYIGTGFWCDACNPRFDEWGWRKVDSET